MIASFVPFLYKRLVEAGLGLGAPLRWAYDFVQKRRGGAVYPWRPGRVPPGGRTPARKLDLQPGELVRVRSYKEILETLTENGFNRGMVFDAETVPFCGGTYRVLRRVDRLIDEKTGKMNVLKNECIVLDGVACQACYAAFRRFCPRSIYSYWREIWLERAVPPSSGPGTDGMTTPRPTAP